MVHHVPRAAMWETTGLDFRVCGLGLNAGDAGSVIDYKYLYCACMLGFIQTCAHAGMNAYANVCMHVHAVNMEATRQHMHRKCQRCGWLQLPVGVSAYW